MANGPKVNAKHPLAGAHRGDGAVDGRTLPLRELDKLKIGYAEDIGKVVANLIKKAQQPNGPAIIDRVVTGLEQIALISEEVGRREGIKEIERKRRYDKTP